MPVICQICQRHFQKLISSTHLRSHGTSTIEYKNKFGRDSIASPEYRSQRSAERSGKNNPMYGRSHSAETKEVLRSARIGKPAFNKGKKLSENALVKLREAVVRREEKYKINGDHPRKGHLLSDESKARISTSVRRYAEENPDMIKSRGQKILKSKKMSGYFDQMRSSTIRKMNDQWKEAGYQILTVDDGYLATLIHAGCGTIISRNLKSMLNEHACTRCYPQPSVSNAEKDLANWLETELELAIIRNDTSLLDEGFEIDIVIPNHRICIEYNGLYWHSERCGKSKWYHITKHSKCQKKGYRLIQIFEDEWVHHKDLVKSRLSTILGKSKSRVGARKCIVRKIKAKVSREFHSMHHLQGQGNGIECYGLYHDGQLIAAMDFNKLSRSKGMKHVDGTWELTRFSSIGTVVGGASRLLNAFIIEHDPTSIISYSDIRWNTGNLYSVIGFKHIGRTIPGYWYAKGDVRYHRYRFRKDRLIAQGHDPKLTEDQIMKGLGYLKIWDCGHDKWEWNKSTPI